MKKIVWERGLYGVYMRGDTETDFEKEHPGDEKTQGRIDVFIRSSTQN